MATENWTKEQTIVVLNLYCKIPFNKVSSNHPDVIRISRIIRRSANSVKMKIGNFGSFDLELKKRGIVGLGNTTKLDKIVWDEYNNNWENLGYDSELIISHFANEPIEKTSNIDINNLPLGKERESVIKTRINQSFFRSTILSSYNSECCITGLSIPDFLVASHIVPWSKDDKIRLNPHNGICINSIHDKAFDKGYITITDEYKIKTSPFLDEYRKENAIEDFFLKYENKPINLPNRFLPSKEFLDYHYHNIFKK
ncbi:restriction endonuclease [Flavobacterium plurextorum]|uniref:Restriction endonuclease n=1 Tax=Flavobacterium plurextorum TaxID=1114867 RepID=A0ABX4CVM8_9FLAO|nr:HNH endonuclease [Flavobacterium plurextorum]OXB08859.1 restriction endonuclease [Flavobacterium plurextorum]